jgi:hypothetical protein
VINFVSIAITSSHISEEVMAMEANQGSGTLRGGVITSPHQTSPITRHALAVTRSGTASAGP